MAEIWLTAEEFENRKQRLEYMKNEGRLAIAEALKEARAQGDLSENAEYDAAKDEQAKMEYDIQQLEEELKNAKIIDESNVDKKTIGVGATVEIEFVNLGMTQTYRIVGSAEADPFENRISNESPIGAALLGHKAKDTIEVQTPSGLQKVRVLRIER
ncbi:MAG: transcription elongation factor GreA [Clostridia bacterium]|nr:transcription elongation factor GreA [Clostridia bacterium]